MNQEERTKYCNLLLYDVMKARSDMREAMGDLESDDSVTDPIMQELEPWIFGERCILPALQKSLSNGPTQGEVMNFSIIAQQSAMLQTMAVFSGRKDPELAEIFEQE